MEDFSRQRVDSLEQEVYDLKREAILKSLRTVKLQKEIDDLKKQVTKCKQDDSLIWVSLGGINTIERHLLDTIEADLYDAETLFRIAHYCFDYYASDPMNVMVACSGNDYNLGTEVVLGTIVRDWWKNNCEKFPQKHEQ